MNRTARAVLAVLAGIAVWVCIMGVSLSYFYATSSSPRECPCVWPLVSAVVIGGPIASLVSGLVAGVLRPMSKRPLRSVPLYSPVLYISVPLLVMLLAEWPPDRQLLLLLLGYCVLCMAGVLLAHCGRWLASRRTRPGGLA
jgi:hypothetical protein